jgi:hypothetical protein
VTAAEHGFVDVIQFLHTELGCTWSTAVCTAAAQRGDMATLTCTPHLHARLSRREGSRPYDARCGPRARAARRALSPLLSSPLLSSPLLSLSFSLSLVLSRRRRLLPRRLTRRPSLSAACADAHEHGCPWSAETTKAAGDVAPFDEGVRASPLAVLQYLHKEGCPWHSDALLCTPSRGSNHATHTDRRGGIWRRWHAAAAARGGGGTRRHTHTRGSAQ